MSCLHPTYAHAAVCCPSLQLAVLRRTYVRAYLLSVCGHSAMSHNADGSQAEANLPGHVWQAQFMKDGWQNFTSDNNDTVNEALNSSPIPDTCDYVLKWGKGKTKNRTSYTISFVTWKQWQANATTRDVRCVFKGSKEIVLDMERWKDSKMREFYIGQLQIQLEKENALEDFAKKEQALKERQDSSGSQQGESVQPPKNWFDGQKETFQCPSASSGPPPDAWDQRAHRTQDGQRGWATSSQNSQRSRDSRNESNAWGYD